MDSSTFLQVRRGTTLHELRLTKPSIPNNTSKSTGPLDDVEVLTNMLRWAQSFAPPRSTPAIRYRISLKRK